ncbi:hypothetical protein [uncultured Thiothrix sp.]|uniref:hypothetical protein n=1 Tax=uncultured Thiothrix sp. TaxID=223185 RepID=UPI0026326446|nr:hypothetical protein [uncultured Thiothrix sp.]HMT91631.1 hypothetical protein [Thiolinea sp.]
MRIVVALVVVLYGLAALYGYYWWNGSQQKFTETRVAQPTATAPVQTTPEPLRFSDVKLADNTQLISQQLQNLQTSFEARLQELQIQQTKTLVSLQKQIDELKQQQAQVLAQTQSSSPASTQTPSADQSSMAALVAEPPPAEQAFESQALQAKPSLKAQLTQLDLKLQTDTPDVARQSVFQQKAENALNQAQLGTLLQTRAECGQSFCKLDIQGQVPTGVDPLQALWEQNVFPESTEVMTIPKPDGSGWLVYIAAEGQSLANTP